MESKRKKIERLENRINRLESWTHPPVDWETKIKSLEQAFIRLYKFVKESFMKK